MGWACGHGPTGSGGGGYRVGCLMGAVIAVHLGFADEGEGCSAKRRAELALLVRVGLAGLSPFVPSVLVCATETANV